MTPEEIQQAAEIQVPTSKKVWDLTETRRKDFKAGVAFAQSKLYTEEDIQKAYNRGAYDANIVMHDADKYLETIRKK